MNKEQQKKRLLWALVVINGVAGILWTLGAFRISSNNKGIDFLSLALGVVNLLASLVWMLNARSS